jgi:hypothetical protein
METLKPMLDVKEAVKAATEFLGPLYPGATGFRLEEVEPGADDIWRVVLSFFPTDPSLSPIEVLSGTGGRKRLYKSIEINKNTGRPIALKMWRA